MGTPRLPGKSTRRHRWRAALRASGRTCSDCGVRHFLRKRKSARGGYVWDDWIALPDGTEIQTRATGACPGARSAS